MSIFLVFDPIYVIRKIQSILTPKDQIQKQCINVIDIITKLENETVVLDNLDANTPWLNSERTEIIDINKMLLSLDIVHLDENTKENPAELKQITAELAELSFYYAKMIRGYCDILNVIDDKIKVLKILEGNMLILTTKDKESVNCRDAIVLITKVFKESINIRENYY